MKLAFVSSEKAGEPAGLFACACFSLRRYGSFHSPSGIQLGMWKSGPDLAQILELLKSSRRRLIASRSVKSEVQHCLGETQRAFETSLELIRRTDEFLERINPAALPKARDRNRLRISGSR